MSKLDELRSINYEVNHQITYVPDEEQYKKQEYWENAFGTDKGDCEDFSIAKVHKLVEAGWDIKDLRIATCFTQWGLPTWGGYHAVLIAKCDNVEYVLSNGIDEVKPVSSYIGRWQWDKVQDVGGSQTWVSAEDWNISRSGGGEKKDYQEINKKPDFFNNV